VNHRRFLFILCGVLLSQSVAVQAEQQDKPSKDTAPKFELLDGDRVVFLGNTLIEREQKYGYWETMLTARYPNRNIIFRNLGWDGDTVWADSRGIFDPPTKGYQRMLEHVGRIKPTVIFLGYGNNEAYAGKKGLPAFIKQYNTLIDDLKKVSEKNVRFVILSPTRREHTDIPDPSYDDRQNKNLEVYSQSLSELASKRGYPFIDFFSRMQKSDQERKKTRKPRIDTRSPIIDMEEDVLNLLTINGVHLWKYGYYDLSQSFGTHFNPYVEKEITSKGRVKSAVGAKVSNLKVNDEQFQFNVTPAYLTRNINLKFSSLQNENLTKYELRVDGKKSQEFSAGTTTVYTTERVIDLTFDKFFVLFHVVYDDHYGDFPLEKLRHAIIEKNLLYFHIWRPQNVTYLFLFRKHEQGQNAKEVEEFRKLLAEKEKEITRLKNR
jgi:hypothetical protein